MSATTKNVVKLYLVQAGAFIWEIVKVIVISLLIIMPVRYFLIQPFYVKGASMEPTFYDYEYLIIDELSYHLGDPDQFDVVVLKDPSGNGQFFIKRVIGLPGDTVVVRDGEISVNGVTIDETAYLDESVYTDGFEQTTFKLEVDEYFVAGDNRSASYDSRRFGPVTEDELIGRVWIRAWPFDRWTHFE